MLHLGGVPILKSFLDTNYESASHQLQLTKNSTLEKKLFIIRVLFNNSD